MLMTSIPNFIREASSSYSYRPENELYSPWIYLLLFVLGLSGAIMALIGREIILPAQVSPTPRDSADQPPEVDEKETYRPAETSAQADY